MFPVMPLVAVCSGKQHKARERGCVILSMVTVKGFGIEGRFWNVVRWLFVIIMGWRFNSGELSVFSRWYWDV